MMLHQDLQLRDIQSSVGDKNSYDVFHSHFKLGKPIVLKPCVAWVPKKEACQIDVILASELGQEFEEIVVAITFLHIWLEVKGKLTNLMVKRAVN